MIMEYSPYVMMELFGCRIAIFKKHIYSGEEYTARDQHIAILQLLERLQQ